MPQAQDAHAAALDALAAIESGIDYTCDAGDCRDCLGCHAYAALALVRSRLVVLEQKRDEARARLKRSETRVVEAAGLFGVTDGGRYWNDWIECHDSWVRKARAAAVSVADIPRGFTDDESAICQRHGRFYSGLAECPVCAVADIPQEGTTTHDEGGNDGRNQG